MIVYLYIIHLIFLSIANSIPSIASAEFNYMGIFNSYQLKTGGIVVMIVWKLATQLPITTKAMSSNPVHDEVCSIQHYVIKFVSELRQVGGFLRGLRFPPPIKLTAKI
jgi:hypothetical protein